MTGSEVWWVTAAVISALGGGGAIVLSLSGWLGKVWAARILEADRLKYQKEFERIKNEMELANRQFQAEMDKTIVVHRMHFEVEFRAIQDAWNGISRLRAAMSVLRPSPSSSVGAAVISRADLKDFEKSSGEFTEALKEARRVLDQCGPFIHHDLDDELYKALGVAMEEATLLHDLTIQATGDPSADLARWYQGSGAHRDAMAEASGRVVDAIRQRLQSLAVYRGTDAKESQ
jgi:hypothetical protein